MGKVSININGRAFAVGCEDGDEQAVAELGQQFNAHVSELAEQVGQIGDLRLFLMAALVMGDQLRESEKNCRKLELQTTDAQDHGAQDLRKGTSTARAAAQALNEAAQRIEALAARLSEDLQ